MRPHTLATSDRQVIIMLTSNEIYAAMAITLEEYRKSNPSFANIADMVMDDMLRCPVWAGDPIDVASNWGDRLYSQSTGNALCGLETLSMLQVTGVTDCILKVPGMTWTMR